MTHLRTVRATGPADLLALVPGFLGFHPEDSVVMVTIGGAVQPFHARVDLPSDHVEIEELGTYLSDVTEQHGVRSLAVVVYTADAALAEAVVDDLARRLQARRAVVVCALRADGGRWWALGRPGGGGGEEAGTPYDVGSHPLMAQTVLDGTVVLGSRRELADTLVGDPAEILEVTRCMKAPLTRLSQVVAAPLGTPAAVHHLEVEGRWVRHRVRRHLESADRLDAADVARLVLLMDLFVSIRDVAWAEMTQDNARQHLDLWRDVLRRAPEGLRAAPAALLGFAAWLSGHGALAWCAVDRAQDDQPGYGLAGLLTQALSAAVPPSVWRPLPPDTLGLFGD